MAPGTGAWRVGMFWVDNRSRRFSGCNVPGNTEVLFSGAPAKDLTVVDDQTIHVTTPAHTSGEVDVQLKTADDTVITSRGGFTYVAIDDADKALLDEVENLFPGPPSLVTTWKSAGSGTPTVLVPGTSIPIDCRVAIGPRPLHTCRTSTATVRPMGSMMRTMTAAEASSRHMSTTCCTESKTTTPLRGIS